MFRRPVSLVNARVVANGRLASSIRFSTRVLGLDEPPGRRDAVVDLEGAFVLPGLVNAHDHLELNHFGRLKFRPVYENASDWIEDMRPRLRANPRIREGRERALSDRLLVGGLKNLLSGVTTVSHHNPFYPELGRRFPIRVVRRYGWAHSFYLEGQPVGARGETGLDIERAYRKTPKDAPFLVHLAEGVDRRARSELRRLDELGCLGANTVLVHGVGLSCEEWTAAAQRGAGLVWCPSSNLFLLGQTAPLREFLRCSASPASIALGTDSRLTGSRDLLEEMRAAHRTASVEPSELFRMVTTSAARLLRIAHAGRISRGVPADLLVIPAMGDDPVRSLLSVSRGVIRLVTLGGRPMVGAPELSDAFTARGVHPGAARLDGAERVLDGTLARRIRSSSIGEPGLELKS